MGNSTCSGAAPWRRYAPRQAGTEALPSLGSHRSSRRLQGAPQVQNNAPHLVAQLHKPRERGEEGGKGDERGEGGGKGDEDILLSLVQAFARAEEVRAGGGQ